MLPIVDLMNKVSETYDLALEEDIENFRESHGYLMSLIPSYASQVRYSGIATKDLNDIMWSNIKTHGAKVTLSVGLLSGIAFTLSTMNIINESFLVTGYLALLGLYLQRKVPTLFKLWKAEQTIDKHTANIYSNVALSIEALQILKDYQATVHGTIEQWISEGRYSHPEKSAENSMEELIKSLTKGNTFDTMDSNDNEHKE